MTDRPVRVIFDRSAIVAYTSEVIAVGELLAEVDDEHGCVAVPLTCLIEAATVAGDSARLEVLVGHPAVVVFADDPGKWRDLAALRDVLGSADAASAALAAIDLDVDIFTRTPLLYAGVAGGEIVLPFDD